MSCQVTAIPTPNLTLLLPYRQPQMTAMLVSIPRNGVAVELLSQSAPAGVAVEKWDLCSDH